MLKLVPCAIRVRCASLVAVCSLFALSSNSSFAIGNLTVTWDPSPDAGVSYKLYYGSASGVYTNNFSTGSATTATVSNLSDGVTYYFAATASDTNGLESIFSNEASGMISPPNQAPTLNGLVNLNINEDAASQTVALSGISSGASNEIQTLTITATSSNPGLIPNPTVNYTSPNATGSLSFTPVASAFGSATITVTVNDGTTNNNTVSRSFSVTVNPVNDQPTLSNLANVSIKEDVGSQTVNLLGISSGAANEIQTLTVTASTSNPGLIPIPTVNYTSPNGTGSLTFAPVTSAFGSATITVTVNDGGTSNSTVSRSFTVTVNPVNDQPTLNTLANLSLGEDAGTQTVNLSGISSGATNENQTLTITAVSSNPTLIPTPTITYTSPNQTGSLAFAPVPSAFGSATITVTVNDGGTSNNTVSRSFTVTVNSVNDQPTLNALANLSIAQDAGTQTINLSGISSGATNESQTLTITAVSSNPTLIPTPSTTYTSPNQTGTLAFTPAASAFGSATITVTVNDGGTSNNTVSRSFTVTINQVNQPPSISEITNCVVAVDTATAAISFTIGDAETLASNLTLSANSDNELLAPVSNIVFGGSGSNRNVTVTPAAGQAGVALISIIVSDGTASATSTFQLTVIPRPFAPGNLRVKLQ